MASADSPDEIGAGLTLSSMVKEIQGLKDKFKREDLDSPSPFADLEKATVLQECRIFSDSRIVTEAPRKCSQLITKLLHIVTQGDSMSSSEVTDVFFGVTKLFQSSDALLRRMVYFFIKEVAETCNPDDVIIVTSSLTKDMNSNEDLFRANSIRVLAKMIDTAMLGAIERYLKQAIVDKNAMVSSSALVAGAHLIRGSPDVVRRWMNEVQEAMHSTSEMVQFQALSLLYEIKCHDRLAISKMVAQLTRTNITSPMATCLLIRYITTMVVGGGDDMLSDAAGRMTYQFLELSLRHRSEAVIYEAAKALCTLPGAEDRDLGPAVAVLQLFLSSPKSTLRLAAMRALSKVATTKPSAVTKCNDDMESLIGDNNRSIATYAITTLLKTGSESSIDRLMKQISSFMNEIADEFKIVIVVAIRELCLKYPLKHRVLVGFLANFLREEGGFDFKKAIVDAIVTLICAIPETKESSLFHLCEFIEDCEFTALSTQILHLVGSLGPTTTAPACYIRFIYNRVILENANVRAAAVTALAKFAAQVPALRASVMVLLDRSLRDNNDEVRDRATFALRLLGKHALQPSESRSVESDYNRNQGDYTSPQVDCGSFAEVGIRLLVDPISVSFSTLSRALQKFESSVDGNGVALNFSTLPNVDDELTQKPPVQVSANAHGSMLIDSVENRSAELSKIPELASLGTIFRTTAPVQLTETETEYVISCVKHVMDDHIILEFIISNTLPEQILIDVCVSVDADPNGCYHVDSHICIPRLQCGATERSWTILRRDRSQVQGMPAQLTAELKFRVIDVDPVTGDIEGDEEGFPEEYPLEDIEISTSDFMSKAESKDFRAEWDNLDKDREVLQKFALQFKEMHVAVAGIIAYLGMKPVGGTGELDANDSPLQHTLHLSGMFIGEIRVMARAQIRIDANSGCVLKLAIRSDVLEVAKLVADCVK